MPFGIVSQPLQTWLNGPRPSEHGSAGHMQPLTAGITKANTGLEGISWNILGQTYVPKSLNEQSFSWHATFPPGTIAACFRIVTGSASSTSPTVNSVGTFTFFRKEVEL